MNLTLLLEENPVIAAVKNNEELENAIKSNVDIIFVLYGDIISIEEISEKIQSKNKIGILHIDLVEGISSKDITIKFIAKNTCFKGIISTKANVVKYAKNYGLFAIQRFFVFDTISLNNSKNHIISECDAIEILPGVIPRVIKDVASYTKKPVVVGGLIDSKDDVILAISAGATSVSTSNKDIWDM